MAISTYPRPKHPIAPCTLAAYLRRVAPGRPGEDAVWLCDLDATAWERFSEAACRRFAERVVQEAARQIMHIRAEMAAEPLPPVPNGTRLPDLQLEVRTFNRLHALWQGRPMGGFAGLTIGDVLGLRAFGTRCLVDLLTSMESFGLGVTVRSAASPLSSECSIGPSSEPAMDRSAGALAPVVPRQWDGRVDGRGPIPSAVLNCVLPPALPRLPLEDAGLGRRTRKVLQRCGFQELGQLAGIAVSELLDLPGFGVSCLTDLVAVAHEHAPAGGPPAAPARPQMCPDVERLLRPTRHLRRMPEHILGSPIPPLPPGVQLRHLGLQPSTRNRLIRAGLWEDPEALADLTLRDLLTLDRFGPARLVDLLECIGRARGAANCTDVRGPQVQAGPNSSRRYSMAEVRSLLASLEATPGIGSLGRGDPRLASWLKAVDPDLETVGELCRVSDRFLATRDIARIVAFCRQVEQWTRDDYQTELLSVVLGKRCGPRNEAIAKALFCLEGRPTATLDSVGREYGLTRERVRQICSPSRWNPNAPPPFAPVLDRLLAAVEARIPCLAAPLEAQLVGQGRLNRGAALDGVLRAAKVLRRTPTFGLLGSGDRRIVLGNEHREQFGALRSLIGHAARRAGAARVQAVRSRARFKHGRSPEKPFVVLAAQSFNGFRWLDEDTGWFLVGNWARGDLARRVREVLAVAGSLSAARLRTALRRDGSLRSAVPPEELLLEFCRRLKACRIERGRIRWNSARPPKKTHRGREAVVLERLERIGPVCTSGQLIAEAAGHSVGPGGVWRVLQECPAVERIGPNRYALRRNRTVQPADERTPQSRRAALCFEWLDSDRFRVAYRVTAKVVRRGVLPLPNELADRVGGRFLLRSRPGIAMGRIGVEAGHWAGLDVPLQYLNAEPGETIRLDGDLAREKLLLRIGDDSLLDELLAGEAEA